jgi:DNA (cytosine-5)-methyltransferase 1
MKILNLYAGIGGNRKLWGNGHDITALESNPRIAEIYAGFFPGDNIVVGDAHQYLLDHYRNFDFIWSSPPCQSHSSFRHNICVRYRGTKPEYPDMRLYEEILFLRHHSKGFWVVENVRPYYAPFIKPEKELQRHLFWSNFGIADMAFRHDNIRTAQIPDLSELHGFDLSGYRLPNKRQVLRNCVLPGLGLHILMQVPADGRPSQNNLEPSCQ